MDKLSFLLLNFFLNSLLSFFTAYLFVKIVIFLFRIRPGRLSAYLQMIPLVKLPLDLFLYDFSRWSYVHGVNPFLCEEGTRSITIMLVWPDLNWFFLPIRSSIECCIPDQNMTFTLADLIGYKTDPLALQIFSIVLSFLSALFILRKFILYKQSLEKLNSLKNHAERFEGKIECPALSSRLSHSKPQVFVSRALTASPFTSGFFSSTIYLPELLLKNFSQNELETVLAHELEHVRYKDNLTRLILDFIGTLFWWIPTRRLRARIEETQEISADLACKKYNMNPIDLASALSKFAKCSTHYFLASCLTRSFAFRRIDRLIAQRGYRYKKLYIAGASLAAIIAIFMIFLGRFWIF